jgi:hypothetical protein
MTKKHISIYLTAAVLLNVVCLLALKLLFILKNLETIPPHTIAHWWPRMYPAIKFAIENFNFILALWFIAVLTSNILLVYFLANQITDHKNLLRASLAALLTLLATELMLRLAGYRPGIHTRVFYFKPVKTLKVFEGAVTDADGILKIDISVRNTVCRHIQNKIHEWDHLNQIEAYSLASENISLIEGKVKNELADYYHQLKLKNPDELTELEKAVIEYIHCPINEEGFRSIAFKPYASPKPKILLLGDSFTWGISASVKTSSFADILLSMGYVVYNTGISATDVAQYLAVARKYIPLLKPDYVIVNFYLGNDITYFKREIIPYKPLLYPTNAGVLMACPHGKYFDSPQAAYHFTLKQFCIPSDDNLFNYLMSKTVLSTFLWKILLKAGIIQYADSEMAQYYKEADSRKYPYPYCNIELNEIRQIATANGARFILSSIPEVYRYVFRTKKDFPDLFDTLPYVEITVSKSDYVLSDGHFNDAGHRKYAFFIDSLIRAY